MKSQLEDSSFMFPFLWRIFSRGATPIKKNRLSARSIAPFFAFYFGTWRVSDTTLAPPEKARELGEWTLKVMEDLEGPKVDLLRAIAHDAITQGDWPSIQIVGTEAYEQVAAGIGNVCRQIQER